MNQILDFDHAWSVVVSLSKPSKMPCYGYSISAKHCITGSKLALVEGSTCCSNVCYAKKGFYGKIFVSSIMEKRYLALKDPLWVEAMIFLIKHLKQAYFRWHDSGDLQGTWHLDNICKVAFGTPETMHWLPTREWDIVKKYLKDMKMPKPPNLVIRLSAFMVEGPAPLELARELGVQCSAVSALNYDCLSKSKLVKTNRNGKPAMVPGYCGACRNCWDDKIECVTYPFH